MFNLQGSELIIILLLALVVLGPEKLPDAMRRAGKAYAELRKMSSGFQDEFRAAVDEPMREIRDTANQLRDSADFTKLESGERAEKPKSAEMAAADPAAVPTDQVPDFETPSDTGPAAAPDSAAAPFADEPDRGVATDHPGDDSVAGDDTVGARRPSVVAPPPPFTGMSASATEPAADPFIADESHDDRGIDGRDAADRDDADHEGAGRIPSVGGDAARVNASPTGPETVEAVAPARPQPFARQSSAAPRPRVDSRPDDPSADVPPAGDEPTGGQSPVEPAARPSVTADDAQRDRADAGAGEPDPDQGVQDEREAEAVEDRSGDPADGRR